MIRVIKQNKGKELSKVAPSKLIDGPWLLSKKYDGHYVQIHYDGNHKLVRFYTSGGKDFYLEDLAEFIKRHFEFSFVIECEFNYNCEGFLGDRGKSAILTTYRTAWLNADIVYGDPDKDIFRVVDVLDRQGDFESRAQWLVTRFGLFTSWFKVPIQTPCPSLKAAQLTVKRWVKEGYEGGMLKSPNHLYQPGKRTNDIIKLKLRPTADLLCIGETVGTGKYVGMLGALVLQDSDGRTVQVGSGLSDSQRALPNNYYIGKIIEIEYEQILDTYIQPTFKWVRGDKEQSD